MDLRKPRSALAMQRSIGAAVERLAVDLYASRGHFLLELIQRLGVGWRYIFNIRGSGWIYIYILYHNILYIIHLSVRTWSIYSICIPISTEPVWFEETSCCRNISPGPPKCVHACIPRNADDNRYRSGDDPQSCPKRSVDGDIHEILSQSFAKRCMQMSHCHVVLPNCLLVFSIIYGICLILFVSFCI